MLLNQISPQSKFTEHARDVRNGLTVFTLAVDFNGQAYIGSGKVTIQFKYDLQKCSWIFLIILFLYFYLTATKKKAAKKICAKSALKSLGVEYDD